MKWCNSFYMSCLGAVLMLAAIDLFTDIGDNPVPFDEENTTNSVTPVPSSANTANANAPFSMQGEIPDFKSIPAGLARKKAFFGYFLPLVKQRNLELIALRTEVSELRAHKTELSQSQKLRLAALANQFKIRSFSIDDERDWVTLLRRIDIVPISLALAQAANESAWGTSRFALEGNNYFGLWCFSQGCGLVPKSRNSGATHEVATFSNPRQSVRQYIYSLNTNSTYLDMRKIREKLRNSQQVISGLKLSAGLLKYSERGAHYVKELNQMIRFNKLDKLDSEF